jgi:hypothetical protein
MRFRIADEFETTAPAYWEMFFGGPYNSGLWPALDVGYEQISFTREGQGEDLVIRREQILTPHRELPGFMKKLVQGALKYREIDVFTARDDRMEVTTIPSVLQDKITSTGVYRLERSGEARVLRVFEGECVCRIPLVGGKIEKQIVSEVEESYRKTTVFTRDWLSSNP